MADSHLYHQFGNSVTVPLIARIAKNIVKALPE
jgi:site-specific DNA-cytosine methylase